MDIKEKRKQYYLNNREKILEKTKKSRLKILFFIHVLIKCYIILYSFPLSGNVHAVLQNIFSVEIECYY